MGGGVQGKVGSKKLGLEKKGPGGSKGEQKEMGRGGQGTEGWEPEKHPQGILPGGFSMLS